MRNAWSPPGTHALVATLARLDSANRRLLELSLVHRRSDEGMPT
jgi:hypothetical protein